MNDVFKLLFVWLFPVFRGWTCTKEWLIYYNRDRKSANVMQRRVEVRDPCTCRRLCPCTSWGFKSVSLFSSYDLRSLTTTLKIHNPRRLWTHVAVGRDNVDVSTMYSNHHGRSSYQLLWCPFYCVLTYRTQQRQRNRTCFRWSTSWIILTTQLPRVRNQPN